MCLCHEYLRERVIRTPIRGYDTYRSRPTVCLALPKSGERRHIMYSQNLQNFDCFYVLHRLTLSHIAYSSDRIRTHIPLCQFL